MIDVFLATYRPNAEMLKAQIDSILAQKGVEVNLIQREDEIGEGACANFSALLKKSRAEYVAFSDQDDVWLSDKLEREMALMRDLEQRYGKDEPLLVFTDLKVTDKVWESVAEGFSGTGWNWRQTLDCSSVDPFATSDIQEWFLPKSWDFVGDLRSCK